MSFLAYRTGSHDDSSFIFRNLRGSSPWPRKEFDWNDDVATRVDMRTTKVKFFTKYLSEGMSDPGKIIRPGK